MRVSHFNGKYNKSKSKMLLFLCQQCDSWYSPQQLHQILGVPLETCRGQCRRLHNSRPPYIRRRRIGGPLFWNAFHYEYQAGIRAHGWLRRAIAAGMPRGQYLDEITDYQRGLGTEEKR